MKNTHQLGHWSGDFGKAYTDRNVVEWQDRLKWFQKILQGLTVERILEIGCNRGHNIVAISHILAKVELVGIEPNSYALGIAKQSAKELHPEAKAEFFQGNIFEIPFPDGSFDLAFTGGVLIHITLDDLPAAMDEIYRVSSRYILAMEYFWDTEYMIHYRGHDDLLWKRNFPKHYLERFPDLKMVRKGEIPSEEAEWWLFEKERSA